MSSSNALDAVALRELYKDVKDNRNLKGNLLAFLEGKVARNEGSQVDEFMEIVVPNEALVVRFFRRLEKLNPKRFSHSDLLGVDMRQKDRSTRALRDFLLWNQGVAPQFAEQPVRGPIASGPMAPRATAVPLAVPISVPPLPATTTRTSAVTPVAKIMPTGPSTVRSAQSILPASSPAIALAKVEPLPLWKNLSGATPPSKGSVSTASSNTGTPSPFPATMSISTTGSTSTTNGAAATGTKRMSTSEPLQAVKIRVVAPRPSLPTEVVDLLGDDDDIELDETQRALSVSFILPDAAGSVATQIKPVTAQSSSTQSRGHVAQAKPSAAPQAPRPPVQSHSRSSSSTVSKTPLPAVAPKLPVYNSTTPQNNHEALVRSLMQRFGVDEHYVRKALRESGNNIGYAQQQISQYRVDLEEARMEDQARLQSEGTAQYDKQRAAQERDAKLSTPQALSEFTDSELLKFSTALSTLVAKAANVIADENERELRKRCIDLLDQEKRAIKWYRDSARAYFRSRKDSFQDLKHSQVAEELEDLKTIMYSTPSERGAPLAFLAALDAESTGGAVQPGVVLGLSADVPIELS